MRQQRESIDRITSSRLARRKSNRQRRCVFILHGRDPARDELAAFLLRLGLKPIILEQQDHAGRTILEQLEAHALRADYAIALLTGDDEGHFAGKPELAKPRARQNVVLELGLFLGVLGRRRVAVLYRDGVELPSDLHGLLYIPFEKIADVRLQLVQAMKHAGLDVDANRAFD
jgi:predicted nucleotide-binding protein